MRTRSRRRLGWTAAGAFALAAGAPSLALAQQSGLFPLAPIRRERVPCPMEDPVYRLYRHQYFGYHPTCWRRFPAGWGCPSPEAPNPAESFRLLPRDVPPAEDGQDTGTGPGTDAMPGPGAEGATPPGGRRGAGGTPANPDTPNPNALPALPPGRSPFDLEAPGTTPRGRGADEGRTTPPGGNAPTPPPADAPPTRPNPGSVDLGGAGLPPVAEPATAAPAPAEPAASTDPAPPAGAVVGVQEQPLLALPDPTVPASPSDGSAPGAPSFPVAGPGVVPGAPVSSGPALAPQRTSLFGNFFSGRLFRRR